MSLPDQSLGLPATVNVNVSQLMPSWQRSSPPINPSGALSAPPPTPVPVQGTGVVEVALIVAPAGLEAEELLNTGITAAIRATTKLVTIKTRNEKRARMIDPVRFTKVETVGIIGRTPAVECRAAGVGGTAGRSGETRANYYARKVT